MCHKAEFQPILTPQEVPDTHKTQVPVTVRACLECHCCIKFSNIICCRHRTGRPDTGDTCYTLNLYRFRVTVVSGWFRSKFVAIQLLCCHTSRHHRRHQKHVRRPCSILDFFPSWALKGSRIGRALVFWTSYALTCIEVCSHSETW